MNRKLNIKLICIASTLVATPVSATILTFSDLNLDDYGQISQDYGDNVNSLNDGIGSYSVGNGFTPNISLSYTTRDAQGNIIEDWIEYWSDNYGDLIDVAFPGQNGHFAEITLSPDQGYSVTLNGFDMAGWSLTDRALDTLQVLNKDGVVLWDSGVDVIHGTGEVHDSFTPNISSNSEITIRWGTEWNIGIDNINFSQHLSNAEETGTCVATFETNGSLDIPCINVPNIFGGITVYQADLQLINFSNPLSFELKGAQIQQPVLGNNECIATFSLESSLDIPCVSVPDQFGGITMYRATMQLIPLSNPFTFELVTAERK